MNNDSKMTIEDLALYIDRKIDMSNKDLLFQIDALAEAVAHGFSAQEIKFGTMVNEKIEGLRAEINENTAKIRNTIWNLDEKFLTKSEFNRFKLRLKSK